MTTASQRPDLPREVEQWRREAQHALVARDYRAAHERCIRILQAVPDHADAMFLLGMIAAEHENFRKAAQVIERAIALDASRAEYHAQLGRCFIALNQPREAMQAALRALQCNPKDALTLDTIGVVMTRAGDYAEAVAPFRRAVALDPRKAAYRYNLGTALQFIGDFSGAQAEYRRAIELDPAHFRAWSSLAQVARAAFTDAEVAHIEALLARAECAPDGVDAQLHLCHALAKHFEDQGQYARAFEYLERGKRRKRAATRYSSDHDAALFAAVRDVCSEAFLAGQSGDESREPLFIVGMPRTGTTLIERILSSHPDVYSAGELTEFALTIKRAAGTSSNLVLDVETLRAAAHLDWKAIGAEYIRGTRPRTGHTRHFIDKMPLNFLYAGFIRRALPNARIICVRRNPLDACLSNYRQLFATQFPYYNYAYDLLDAGRYYVLFDSLAKYWRETLGERYCEVAYEDVVADTEAQARRLIAFCGLEWHPACLEFHANAAPVATASSVQVRQPIYRTSIGRWKRFSSAIDPLRMLLSQHGLVDPAS